MPLISMGEAQIHGGGFPTTILYNVTLYPLPWTLVALSGLRAGTRLTLVEVGFIWSQTLQVAKHET